MATHVVAPKHALTHSCSDKVTAKRARVSEKGSTPSCPATASNSGPCEGAAAPAVPLPLPWMMPAAGITSGGSACGASTPAAPPPMPNPMLMPPPPSMLPPFFMGPPGGMGMMPPQMMAMQACMMMQMQAMQMQAMMQHQQQQAAGRGSDAQATTSKPTAAAAAAASLGFPEPLPCYPTCFPFMPPGCMPGMPPPMCFPPPMLPQASAPPAPAQSAPAKQQQLAAPAKQQAPAAQPALIPAAPPLATLAPAATTNLTDADFAAFIDSFVSDVDPASSEALELDSGSSCADVARLDGGSVRSSSGSESDDFVFSLDDLLPLAAVTQQVESALMELSAATTRPQAQHAPQRPAAAAPATTTPRIPLVPAAPKAPLLKQLAVSSPSDVDVHSSCFQPSDLLQLDDDGEESDLIFGVSCHGLLQGC